MRVLLLLLLFAGALNAQNRSGKLDLIATSELKDMQFTVKGKQVSTEAIVFTRKSMKRKFGSNQANLLNPNPLNTPVKVVKVMIIDTDNDGIYDYIDKKSTTLKRGSNLLSDDNINFDTVLDSNKLSGSRKMTGNGYFNSEGKFIYNLVNGSKGTI